MFARHPAGLKFSLCTNKAAMQASHDVYEQGHRRHVRHFNAL